MAKLKLMDFYTPLLIAILLLCIYNYYKYIQIEEENFSGNWAKDTVFHPVTDVPPSLCAKDNDCSTSKCTGSGYCAV